MTTTPFARQYGPWACIAGASMGIGRALSHEAAARGLNVVMVARGAETLEETAAEVRDRHGVDVRTLVADLADPAIGETVAAATDDIEIGLFVYNAAVAPMGRFLDIPLDLQLLSVAVNCRTPVILCHLLASRMVARGRGGIALVSSNGGTQGAVNTSTYGAGKAFEWILGETLWTELGESGVDVTTIFVGPTASPNYNAFKETLDPELCNRPDSDDPLDRMRARLMDPSPPEEVATALYDQLAQGPVCYSRPEDAWIGRASLNLPRDEATLMWRKLQETSTRRPERQAR
jgi:short-subunit dehydrogenase